MSTCEDSYSYGLHFDQQAQIGLITVYNSMSKKSDKETYFFDIHSLKEAYQEVISKNARIVETFKKMKKKSI